jgi:hypothetical protein
MRIPTRTTAAVLLAAAAVAAGGAPAPAADKPGATAGEEDPRTLRGGEEGTVFRSLTVTGEDRIRIEFDRPALRVELDPRTAPGLDWGESMDVLAVPEVDLVGPLAALSAVEPSPRAPRPWIDHFRTDAVARFRPELEGVAQWRLTVVDSRSDTVATFQGKGNPPEEIAWDGRSRGGEPVPPGVTCSYVLEATDRAGNGRSFVGEGFTLPPYRVEGSRGSTLLFAGPATRELLLETATRLDQGVPAGGPVEVKAAAPQVADAEALAAQVAGFLREHTLGDPARIRAVAEVRSDVPAAGTVSVIVGASTPGAPVGGGKPGRPSPDSRGR